MQIFLKQKEIVEALKAFISNQGINLTGKTVEVEFTSGRKDNGLSAEMSIEDTGIQIPTGPVPRTMTNEVTEVTNTADEVASVKLPSLFK